MLNRPHPGGRPGHPWARELIPLMVRDLKRARVADLQRFYKNRTGRSVSQSTLKKYCELLAEEGALERDVEIDNRATMPAGCLKRRWQMVWYTLP